MAEQNTLYLTSKQTADRWGISKRRVNMYASEGRLPGAIRTESVWLIPLDAARPVDMRREKHCMPAQLTSFQSGQPDELPSMDDLRALASTFTAPTPYDMTEAAAYTGLQRRIDLIIRASMAYATGDFSRVLEYSKLLRDDPAARVRIGSEALASAISLGDYAFFEQEEAFLNRIILRSDDPQVKMIAQLVLSSAYLGAMAPDLVPDWIKNGSFSALPQPMRWDAAYKQAKYFQSIGRYDLMMSVANTALQFLENPGNLSLVDAYLRLMCAGGCLGMDRAEEAETILKETMSRYLPLGIITPFAESVPAFCGLCEQLIQQNYPHLFDAVKRQLQTTFSGWIIFHNRFTKGHITTMLSMREYQISLMAAQRIPRTRIAAFFSISEGRLNNILKEIYAKLCVKNRDELAKYVSMLRADD